MHDYDKRTPLVKGKLDLHIWGGSGGFHVAIETPAECIIDEDEDTYATLDIVDLAASRLVRRFTNELVKATIAME